MVNKMRRELTLKQTAVLRAVEEFVLGHGYAPTVRGLAAALKMANPSAVFKHLQSLERKGYLTREGGEIRVDGKSMIDAYIDNGGRVLIRKRPVLCPG